MTKDDMRVGFAQGRSLTQEEWSTADEIRAIDELAAEGACTVTPWEYHDNYQCERRKARGVLIVTDGSA